MFLLLLRTSCCLVGRAQCLLVGGLGAKQLTLLLIYFFASVFQLLLNQSSRTYTYGHNYCEELHSKMLFKGCMKSCHLSLEYL